ncbi:hypothetical protein CCR75_007934 [Bremia lactucae]|uniref:Uncharacterized protein n=1 Tax=Bremia lactucae TaxID=4779 RepID=A0A976FGP5_BRELC|nr:hypothetical protein CCR75_007934 [Bremia lactucae]
MVVIVPRWGARTSTLTLSVSTTSSSVTASPGCFNLFYDSSFRDQITHVWQKNVGSNELVAAMRLKRCTQAGKSACSM